MALPSITDGQIALDPVNRIFYYLDSDGNLVIEIDIIKRAENIETELSSSGTMSRIEL